MNVGLLVVKGMYMSTISTSLSDNRHNRFKMNIQYCMPSSNFLLNFKTTLEEDYKESHR